MPVTYLLASDAIFSISPKCWQKAWIFYENVVRKIKRNISLTLGSLYKEENLNMSYLGIEVKIIKRNMKNKTIQPQYSKLY